MTPDRPLDIADQRSLSSADLRSTIIRHGIDLSKWGVNGTKSLVDLEHEINKGEATLSEVGGRLVRQIRAVRISVATENPSGDSLCLVEDRQEFNDKERSVRRRPTPWAVWEKLLLNEDSLTAARRAIKEELKIDTGNLIHRAELKLRELPQDYPEIPTEIQLSEYSTNLPWDSAYAAGFIESQSAKSTYFTWHHYDLEIKKKAGEYLGFSPDRLSRLRLELAAKCHGQYLEKIKLAPASVVLAEVFSKGLISESLTSFDGSSKYLSGALYPSSNERALSFVDDNMSFGDRARAFGRKTLNFCKERGLPGDTIISNFAVINPDYGIALFIRAGELEEELFLDRRAAPTLNIEDFIRNAKEVTAILTLELLQKQQVESSSITPTTDCGDDKLFAGVLELRELQECEWPILERALSTRGDRLVVGESFTFGKLARLLAAKHSSPEVLQTVFGWYDKRFKTTLGVAERLVSDSQIASSETIISATKGLLTQLDRDANLAIGTSGWANYWKSGEEDHFSVALANRDNISGPPTSLSMNVSASKESQLCFARRALTRELGVTAALYLLSRHLCDQGVQDLDESVSKLEVALKSFGSIKVSKAVK